MRILVIAKAPVAGRVKTRLCPPLTPGQAADVAAAALHDTLAAAGACAATERVLALDGAPGDWLPPGWRIQAQCGGTFAERLAHAWAMAGGPALQIGMDTPQLTVTQLDHALGRLESVGCVIGPTADGGWWGLGLRRDEPDAFRGVPMSQPTTLTHQLQRLRELGHDPQLLDPLVDVDTWPDALAVADEAPATRFASTVSVLDEALATSGVQQVRP